MLHKNVQSDNNHGVFSLSFANSADRTAFTNETNGNENGADQVGKIAVQTNTGTMWILTDNSPLTWVELGAAAAGGNIYGPDFADGFSMREPFIVRSANGFFTGGKDSAGSGGGFETALTDSVAPLHQGVVQQWLTATGHVWTSSQDGNGQMIIPAPADGTIRLKWICKVPLLSTATDTFVTQWGFSQDPHLSYSNYWVTCKYTHSTNSGQFQLELKNNATPTTVNTSFTLVADQWIYCELVLVDDSVTLYIDTSLATRTLRATATTGIPTAQMCPVFYANITAIVEPAIATLKLDDVFLTYELA